MTTSKRAPRTRETYERAVAAFRGAPGNALQAARASGLDRKGLARLWREGWPSYPWARPISVVLDEERAEAERRASVALKAEADARDASAARAREANIATRAEDAQLVMVGRRAVTEIARAAIAHRELISTLLDRIEREAPTMPVKNLAPLLRELRQLFAEVPKLAIALAEEGREARAEENRGAAPGSQAVGPADDAPMPDVLDELAAAVGMLAQFVGRDRQMPPGWSPSEGLRRDVKRLGQVFFVEALEEEPFADGVGYEVDGAPIRVISTLVEQRDDETEEDAPPGTELAVFYEPPLERAPAPPPFVVRPGRTTR